jgi:hypothetical protein
MPSTRDALSLGQEALPYQRFLLLDFPPKEEGTMMAGQKQNPSSWQLFLCPKYSLSKIQFMNYGVKYEYLVRYEPQLHPEDSGMFNSLPETALQH